MNIFTEATRVAKLVEAFARDNPVTVRSSTAVLPARRSAASPQQKVPRSSRTLREVEQVLFMDGY
jgi:hypothetical protein